MVPIRLRLQPGAVRMIGAPGHEAVRFEAGKVMEVPGPLAEVCLAKREQGEFIFERANKQEHDKDILNALGVQLEWKDWPSTLQ